MGIYQAGRRCTGNAANELENGLLKYMLHHDYESINVSDFCDALAIPRKSFYRYFTNKDGALYALVDHTLMDFTKEFFTGEAKMDLNAAIFTK